MKKNNKKLQIVFLDFDDIRNPLLGAGQARATFEVGRRLAAKGHSITSICSRYPGCNDRTEGGIRYRHIGLGSNNIKLNNLAYIFAIPSAVRKLKADIIIECFTAPISTLFSPLWTKIPVVAIPTSFEAERFAKSYHFPFDLIEKFGLRYYKYFLPYSSYQEKKMKNINQHVISMIVPEGVGEEFFAIKRAQPKHILFLGRFDIDQKGIDILLNAYAKKQDEIHFPIVIAGKGPDEKKIISTIKSLKLEKKVSIVGEAYGEKKEKLLAEAVFVAMPSRHEGFSLFSLEALASGAPLVVFDIPGMSWFNGSVSLKAKPFDIDQYGDLLIKASSIFPTKKMETAIKEFARKFSWDFVADQYESFFLKIIKRGN